MEKILDIVNDIFYIMFVFLSINSSARRGPQPRPEPEESCA
jgi:hypothetical protein